MENGEFLLCHLIRTGIWIRLNRLSFSDLSGLGIIVIGLSVVVTTLTGISMSAICTNGVVRGGKWIWSHEKYKNV